MVERKTSFCKKGVLLDRGEGLFDQEVWGGVKGGS